jgi:hypothetical protein
MASYHGRELLAKTTNGEKLELLNRTKKPGKQVVGIPPRIFGRS